MEAEPHNHFDKIRELAMHAIFGERRHAVAWDAAQAERPYIADADRMLYQPVNGLFGVFDGVGYTGAPASEAAARYVGARHAEITSPHKLAKILVTASGEIYRGRDTHGSQTTATIAKLTATDNGAEVIWASVGDSRLYRIGSNGQVKQISRDEGSEEIITNALGWEGCKVEQYGKFELAHGESLLLVTDGITGDKGNQLMSEKELSSHFRTARGNPEDFAHMLTHVARKPDDRTVIALTVHS